MNFGININNILIDRFIQNYIKRTAKIILFN